MPYIDLEIKAPVAYIFFNRPDKWNAMHTALLEELGQILDQAAADPEIRLLVLSGKGKAFSSGVDLKALQALDTVDEAKQFAMLLEEVSEKIFLHPKPVVAVVNGLALGGGFGFATAADLRIAGSEAVISYPAVKLGAILPAGCTVFLESIVGRAKAMDLLLTGKKLDANQALEIGLVDYVFDHTQLWDQTEALIGQILEGGDTALQLTKKTVNYRTQFFLNAVKMYAPDNFAYLSKTPDWESRLKHFGKK